MWTKNGSIPQLDTDGTEGWLEVDAPPEAPEGKEVVWLNWEWVVRDPKPVDREGYRWKWNHDQMQWIEYQMINIVIDDIATQATINISSGDIPALVSADIGALNG